MSGIIAQNSGRHTGLVKASSGGGGVWNLIQTLTSDGSDATLNFTTGIDSTYDEYVFKIHNIHPETDSVYLQFNASTDGGSNYNVTKQTVFYRAAHDEADSTTVFGQDTGEDLAQSTAYQGLNVSIGNDNDQSCSGELYLFNPSSTTFVTHFIATMINSQPSDLAYPRYIAGYFNLTGAIDEIQFKMSSGNIDAGTFKLYGIKDS